MLWCFLYPQLKTTIGEIFEKIQNRKYVDGKGYWNVAMDIAVEGFSTCWVKILEPGSQLEVG